MNNQLDLICIGDTVVDAFIKLTTANVNCKIDNSSCEISMPFGAKVPYESVTVVPSVGNSANAAVSAARLGLKAGLVTFLGNDINGRECKFSLENEKVATDFVIMENGKTTNYHYVLWFGDERTILIKHETFKVYLPPIGTPKWIYLSSLGEHAKGLHTELIHYLKQHPSVKLAFQPGTFQIKMGAEELKEIYQLAEFFCVNVEEAQQILNTNSRDLKALLRGIEALGPRIICITDGKNGSYLRSAGEDYFIPVYPDIKPPYERTGAGDAFTSTFVASLVSGMSPIDALRIAPINSMNVVQHIGAQKGLLSMHELNHYLNTAPAHYKVTKL